MSDSPGDNLHHRHEEEGQKMTIQNRLCDFCGDSMALLYCRADSAKLCLSCDREVHSTNQLFTKHTRSRLCDVCDASPASILCSTDNLVLCQNCDWAKHGRSLSSAHDRRPLEGFSGQPSVTELLAFVGFEDLGKKSLFCGDESEVNEFLGCGVYESVGVDEEFSDFLVWDTPAVVNLDDLIVSTACDHNFQAMGVPPLPKNRGAPCGQHKAEIIHQLRQLAKIELSFDFDHGDAKPPIGFQSHIPKQLIQKENECNSCDHEVEFVFPTYEASAFQWCSDGSEAANQVLPSVLLGSCADEKCLVPRKHSDIGGSVSHTNGSDEGKSECPVVTKTLPALPKVSVHELNSQERDSAISRYKEKKKTRRYEKHIRYESRKARAESRIRIKGRFAKMDH
ncbi:zinc finger protein CONSTANS-LIKE 13 [Vitis vinifera]|uniref:CONSTANS-like protein 13 n=2 Tax=Vitis vinifera TaxID=29760 RepID=F6HQ13_VITVI|nr:zinc finger protein CONSTANS-LIKE 13 [Vitis vinifera]ATD87383.1 CONSTANS-like protein 13 [Vitis vinifera]|eukprot:XP_002268490.1 PREDICTED: zinc finger protein CONSTANS-LIKE 13 [Vitis vinifera]